MRNAILSLLVLIIILVLIRHDVLNLLTSDIFHYIAYGTFIVVMGSAVYFVGIKKTNKQETPAETQRKDNPDDK